MKRLSLVGLAAFLTFALSALGNEQYLGTLTVIGADSGVNAMFNLRQPDAGFRIPYLAKLSMQPSGGAYICVDSHVNNAGVVTCSTATGVLVSAGTLFPTSCSTGRPVISATQDLQADGGYSVDGGGTMTTVYLQSCSVAALALDGGTVVIPVWSRIGDEAVGK